MDSVQNFKPGDVVVLESLGLRGFVTAKGAGCGPHICAGLHVHYEDGDWDTCDIDGLRPLVVIDLEDRGQVERLLSIYMANVAVDQGDLDDCMQAALREFASPTPPKPDEPTAMWSVVVDGAGDQWVRVLGPDFTDGWVRAGDLPSNGKWTDYRKIDAVKVLSPGVEAGEPS